MARHVPASGLSTGVSSSRKPDSVDGSGTGHGNGSDSATLALLGAAGFLSLASTRVCDAMLPALAQAFDTSTAQAAATVYAYAIAYGAMQLVYGPLGDRFGKQRVIALATAACALSTALAALAPSLGALIIARVAMGASTAAIVPLGLAWIGDTVPMAGRQQALARYAGLTVVGVMVGPLLGGFLTQVLSWRAAFVLLAAAFGFMALVLWLRARTAAPPAHAVHAARGPYMRQVAALLAAPWTRVVLAVAIFEAGLGIGALAFVPTVLHTRFGLSLTEGGAMVALFGLGGFVFSRSAAPLLRRVRPPSLPGIAGAVMALAFGLLAVMPHWGWAAAGCVVAGFGFFMMHNTLQVQATQLSATASGLAMSLFACCIFMGQSVGVVVGAITFTRLAPEWSFAGAGAGLLVLGFVLMHLLRARAAL